MKDEHYLNAFDVPEPQVIEHHEPELTAHQKVMRAFERLNQKCDEALERVRKRKQRS